MLTSVDKSDSIDWYPYPGVHFYFIYDYNLCIVCTSYYIKVVMEVVGRVRIELTTNRLKVYCSAN